VAGIAEKLLSKDVVKRPAQPGATTIPIPTPDFGGAQPPSSGQLKPTVPPGGVWVTAPPDGASVSDTTLYLDARAYPSASGGAAITHVNFTVWWPAVGPVSGPWRSVCDWALPAYGDHYVCAVDLSAIPSGEFRVSFDVYDTSGQRTLAPNGVRTLRRIADDGPSITNTPTPSRPTNTPTPPRPTNTPTPFRPTDTPTPFRPTNTPTPVPASVSVSIWTDHTDYAIGDPATVCYSVSRAGRIRITDTRANGRVSVVLDGVDDGRGDCLPGTIDGPAGTETMRIEFFDSSGRVVASDDVRFVVRASGGSGGGGGTGGGGTGGGACTRAPSSPTNVHWIAGTTTLTWDVADPGGPGCTLSYEINSFGGQLISRGSSNQFTFSQTTACDSQFAVFIGAANQNFGFHFYTLFGTSACKS
jgi:hypothetical protein